ncbi:hypothetical protein [Amycolatopsis sp. WAC 01375]|uniref:hypothetical protein n=1 Tax=Amycolatopsis sp. WAC 01375 TaxID=2203194 RepID=UPI000F788B1B|nr:hypothetical protein [Amycolatopsis sp. WAC 01375]
MEQNQRLPKTFPGLLDLVQFLINDAQTGESQAFAVSVADFFQNLHVVAKAQLRVDPQPQVPFQSVPKGPRCSATQAWSEHARRGSPPEAHDTPLEYQQLITLTSASGKWIACIPASPMQLKSHDSESRVFQLSGVLLGRALRTLVMITYRQWVGRGAAGQGVDADRAVAAWGDGTPTPIPGIRTALR